MSHGSTPAPDDDLLGPILESFVGRFRRGERPSLTELIARHPELAGQIRELVPALVDLEQLAGSPRGPGGSARHGAASAITRDEGPSPERLGDYRILRRIGGGGMGVVYEAEHVALRRSVALKVMLPRLRDDPRYLRRFQSEASLAAGLHHTNIVGVFDYGEQDGVCYYAMQLIEGQPLDRVLADIRLLREDPQQGDPHSGCEEPRITPAAGSAAVRGLLTGRFAAAMTADAVGDATLPIGVSDPEATGSSGTGTEATGPADVPADRPSSLGSSTLGPSGELRYYREIARIGAQVADALEYAHRRRIVHRDIKPSNLLLDAQGNVWVTDFGLSRFEDGADLTQSRELVGTLRYMAPERLRGKSDCGSDVYSLGATLYEMVALRPPFEEADEIRLMERIRNDAPPSPRQLDRKLPRDLETILQKALAKDPKDRFSSAGALAEELRRFIDGRPIRSRPVSVPEQFWRWCKRDPWLSGASIAAVTVTILLALGVDGRGDRLSQPGRGAAGGAESLGWGVARCQPTGGRRVYGPSPSRPVQPAPRAALRDPRGGKSGREAARQPSTGTGYRLPARRAPRPGDCRAGLARPQADRPGRSRARRRDLYRVRFRNVPLRAAVPRGDDLGPPRRRRPGGRHVPGPGRSRRWDLLQPRRPLPGGHPFPRRRPDSLGC